MASLSLNSIYKVYPNGTKAVNDFNMEIYDKEFIVFVGPSGCGKSTVLRMIAGLEEISAGELKIDDDVVNDVDCKNRDTAMVFQNYALYPHMTVAENMAFPLKMAKLTKREKLNLSNAVDEKYPPVMSKQYCKKIAKKNYILEMTEKGKFTSKSVKLTSSDIAEIEKRADKLFADYNLRKEQNDKVRADYKINKKVDLTADDKAQISDAVKQTYSKSFKNFIFKPLHYFAIKREYIKEIRSDKKLVRPISYFNNIAKPFHVKSEKRDNMFTRVVQIAEILGLEDYLGVKPGAMSGGQRQRVALGRAMVRNPKVFLLDEPLSNLDAKLRTQMRSEITKLHNRLQTTFIYVTHDQTEAMTMGDRIVVMKKGCIQQIDTPINLYLYPDNKFVAGFIGTPSMNFFDAVITVDGDTASLNFANDKKLNVPIDTLRKFTKSYYGKQIILGVRPEDFIIDKNGVSCKIVNREILGDEVLLYCDFDVENCTDYENSKYGFIVKAEGLCPCKSGDIINVLIKFSAAHYFDKDSEENIAPRLVKNNDISVTVENNKLIIGENAINLPAAMSGISGNLRAQFPVSSVQLGKSFVAKVCECEEISEQYLARIEIGGVSLYMLSKDKLSGEISVDIDLKSIRFVDGEREVKGSLNCVNDIDVILKKRKLSAEQIKNLPQSEYRKFDVDIICGDKAITCPVNILKRILSASDRKLFDVPMTLRFNASDITNEETFSTNVKYVLDYGKEKFAVCDFMGKEIILSSNGKESTIKFGINVSVANIYEQQSGIKIS